MMIAVKSCLFLLSLLLILPNFSHGGLSDILKLDTQVTYGAPVEPDQLFKLLTGGISQVFWQYVNSTSFDSVESVSSACKQSLIIVRNGLAQSLVTSFKFIDAAGKSAPGFLRITPGTLGDFDQCLSINDTIDGSTLLGKYCAYDTYPLKTVHVSESTVAFDRLGIFEGPPYINSICVPSECDEVDTRNLISDGDINCDTRESASFDNRVASLNSTQKFAGYFILFMITLVLTSTVLDISIRSSILKVPNSIEQKVISASVIRSTSQLFHAPPYDEGEAFWFDIGKHFLVFCAIIGHAFTCFEIPLGFYILGKHDAIKFLVSPSNSWFSRPESQLAVLPVMSGITYALIAYPMARKASFNPFLAILHRFTRLMPIIVASTAIELVSPIFGDGPLWSRVGTFVANKCTRNWWRNFLFINNQAIDVLDICGGASFYTSVDMHLFILGTVMIVLLSTKSSLACTFAVASSVLCMLHTSFNMLKHDAPAFVLESYSVTRMVSYMNYVHMVTSTYVPAYMIGMLTGYFVVQNRQLIRFHSRSHAFYKLLSSLIVFLSLVFLMASTTFFSIPRTFMPLLVILTRICAAFNVRNGLLLLIAYRNYRKQQTGALDRKKSDDVKERVQDADVKHPMNFLRGMNRLSTPLFFINYVVIRTLFFRERAIYSTDVFPVVSEATEVNRFTGLMYFFVPFQITRMIITIFYCYVAAFFTQLFILAPLDSARRWLLKKIIESKEKQN